MYSFLLYFQLLSDQGFRAFSGCSKHQIKSQNFMTTFTKTIRLVLPSPHTISSSFISQSKCIFAESLDSLIQCVPRRNYVLDEPKIHLVHYSLQKYQQEVGAKEFMTGQCSSRGPQSAHSWPGVSEGIELLSNSFTIHVPQNPPLLVPPPSTPNSTYTL